MRNFRKPSQAVQVPRLVSKLELKVMSSCLVRQGRDVEDGIWSLQANLRYSEARIKGTYKEVSLVHAGVGLMPAHYDGAQGKQLGIPALHR